MVILLIGFGQTWAQWTYTTAVYPNSGNPGGVNTEGDAPGLGTWTDIVIGPQSVNIWSPVQTIPFAFDFYGTPVTQYKVSQNGVLTFDIAAVAVPTNQNYNLPTATGLPNLSIAGFWDSFTSSPPTGSGDNIRVNVFGSAPNRQLWVKYYSFEIGSPVNSFRYWAFVLEETTNKIYVVDQYANSTVMSSTCGVQLNPTTAIQIGDSLLPLEGNGTATTDNDVYEFTPVFLTPHDAGVSQFISPGIGVSGTYPIEVEITNYGTSNLTSATVSWTYNGAAQTPFSWTGNLPNGGKDTVTLGTLALSSLDTFCAWTSLPNGNVDGNFANDTLCINWCPGLTGTYTVGGVGADYATLSDAVAACYLCGVAGNVNFDVNAGAYIDSLRFTPIPGSGPSAVVTFDGGDRNLVSVTHNGGREAVVEIKGADYLTFRNMTFTNPRTSDAWGFHLRDTAEYITIDSCRIVMVTGTTSDVDAICASGDLLSSFAEGNNAFHLTITHNIIENGYNSIHFEGNATIGSYMMDFTIEGNEMMNFYNSGIYTDNVDGLVVRSNKMQGQSGTISDGIYTFDLMNFDFSLNEINVADWGIYVSNGNYNYPPTMISRVVGNMVSSQTDYATYLIRVDSVNVNGNSFRSGGFYGFRINDYTYTSIQNNIFQSDANYCYYADDATSLGAGNTLNYNIYWTPLSIVPFAYSAGTIIADLATWQAGVPADNANSYERDPFFISTTNLHVVGANCNDVGLNAVSDPFDLDGDARPLSPSVTVDIGADEYTPVANDAVAVAFITPSSGCGDSLTVVSIAVQNLGTTTITSLPVSVMATGAVTQTMNLTYAGPIAFWETDTILVGTINTYAGGTVNLSGYITLAGDADNSNDTLGAISPTFIPYIPVGINGVSCGGDSAYIYGQPWSGVQYNWFASPTDTVPLATADSFLVPSIVSQGTYYLEYANNSDSLSTGFPGGNGQAGNMFDIGVVNTTTITGIAGNFNSGTNVVDVWYRTDSYVNSPNSSAGWIQVVSGATVVSSGNGQGTLIPVPLNITIPAGQQYGFFLLCTTGGVAYTNGVTVGGSWATNGDMTIYEGIGRATPAFTGSTFSPRNINCTVYFGSSGCSNVRVPVSAIAATPPMVNLGNDTLSCSGSFVLDAGNSGSTYAWSDGSAQQTLSVSTSGTYSVEVTDANGCTANDTVNLMVSTAPVVALGNDALLCDGASITLDAGNAGASYAWSTGGSAMTETVSTAGTVSVAVTDTTGCVGMDTINITTGQTPAAAFTQTQGPGNGLTWDFTDASSNAPTTWAWNFGDGNTSTAQNPTHSYAVDGSYTVTLIATNDCGSDTFTVPITVLQAGAALGVNGSASFFPNPNNGQFTLTLSGVFAQTVGIDVFDSRGQLVRNISLGQVNGSYTLPVDLNGAASGIYLLKVTAEGQVANLRVTVE